MASTPLLTLAFLESQPRAAARVLQDLAVDDAAGFLADTPPRLAGLALGAMTPWAAARCLREMEPSRAALLVEEIDAAQAAHLLRLLGREHVEHLLQFLPTRTATAYRHSLEFPTGSVGAWTDHAMPVLVEHDRVADALRLLSELQTAAALSHVFVVDQRRRLSGAVNVRQLLAAAEHTPIGTLMQRPAATLLAQLPISAVAQSPGWDQSLVLPVVNERTVFLGGLTRAALRRGLELDHSQPEVSGDRSITAQLAAAAVVCGAGLVSTLLVTRDKAR